MRVGEIVACQTDRATVYMFPYTLNAASDDSYTYMWRDEVGIVLRLDITAREVYVATVRSQGWVGIPYVYVV